MATPRPNRLGLYADVKEILDQCLKTNGGEYTLESYNKAVHWRQRAYKFRKLYAETLSPGLLSPYDSITIPRIAPNSSTVLLVKQKATGIFKPTRPVKEEPDDLMKDAKDFAKRLSEGKVF